MLLTALLLLPAAMKAQVTGVRSGNSYLNLSKKTAGGTIEPGDTLEIRTNYYLTKAFNPTAGYYYLMRYVDNIPTNTIYATPVSDSLRLITNEGLVVSRFTNATNDDAGRFNANPNRSIGEYDIRINIGNSAGNVTTTTNAPAGGGTVQAGATLPLLSGGTLITTAFKVVVTGMPGDTITLGTGQLLFKKVNSTSSGPGREDYIVSAIPYKILISKNSPICADAVGKNFAEEAGGTFDSGSTQNRSYAGTNIPGYGYRALTPTSETNDGYYTIVNNLSPRASTFQGAKKKPNCTGATLPSPLACDNRMFGGHWDIIGDHTGSTTPAGNPPAAPGTEGGYMLVVNAEYATGEAYRQNITGLCPNTSYEFSLWVRNVCTNCGIDMNGVQTWKPGVLPNLTFAIDDLDRYSSGQVDTVGWIKKGFMFKTGSAQTGITISIRNNASGGGGNDWAIDDIALVTCNPNLTMLPSATTTVCAGDQVRISCLVQSFFDNYTQFTWERSTNGGASWSNTGSSGTGNAQPTGGGQYSYEAIYPSWLANASDNGNMYRFKVASTTGNLTDPNCSFLNTTTIQVRVNNCQVLSTKLVSFTGRLVNNLTNLQWTTQNESELTYFEVERSTDGTHFTRIGSVNGSGKAGSGNTYNYTDNTPLAGPTYYRLLIKENGNAWYSKVVLLGHQLDFTVRSVVNPFTQQLNFELISPDPGMASLSLVDMYGRIVNRSTQSVTKGLNNMSITGLDALSRGVYVLRIQMGDKLINKQVVKADR